MKQNLSQEETQAYISYLENELQLIRDLLTEDFSLFDSGSVADDVTTLLNELTD